MKSRYKKKEKSSFNAYSTTWLPKKGDRIEKQIDLQKKIMNTKKIKEGAIKVPT